MDDQSPFQFGGTAEIESSPADDPNGWLVLEAIGRVLELRPSNSHPIVAPKFEERSEQDRVYTYLLGYWAASGLENDSTLRWVDRTGVVEACSVADDDWIYHDDWIHSESDSFAIRTDTIDDAAEHLIESYGEWLDDTISRL